MAKPHRVYSVAEGASAQVLKSRVPGEWEGWGDLAPRTCMTPDEARKQGYRMVSDYADAKGITPTSAANYLTEQFRRKLLERIPVRLPGVRPAYAYRPVKRKEQ